MLKRVCRPALWALVGCAVVCLIWSGRPVVAQDEVADPPAIVLDLQQFIESAGTGGRPQRFNDEVWDIRPETNRRTVLLPIRVTPGEMEYELSRPSVGMRAARFIGWYIPPPARGQRSGGNAPFPTGQGLDLNALLLGEGDDKDMPINGRADRGNSLDGSTGDMQSDAFDAVPEGAPRLSRKITIHPDGSVGWGMDRAFSGATVRSSGQSNLYGYKLDPEALRNQQPERLERLERQQGESSRDYSQRRRAQQETFRDASTAFRELRAEVLALPDEFRDPGTGLVYAVYDAPLDERWVFIGDDPMPWTIDQEDLDTIASLANIQGQGSSTGPDARTLETVQALIRLANRGGVMDHRAIALAAYQGRLADQVVRHGKGFDLLDTLVSSPDEQTRVIALASIARVQPPTRASVQLLAQAANDAQGELAQTLQLASMRSSFRIEAGPQGNADLLLAQINNALADRNGPSAARVLEEAIDAVALASNPAGNGSRPGRGAQPAEAPEDGLTALVSETAFEQIQIDQLEEAIAVVIRRSPDSALAARWLDVQLLRSIDTDLTDQTLALLAKADSASRVIRPLASELLSVVLGASTDDTGPSENAIVLEGVIPLDGEAHGLVVALTSADETRRALAWQVLRHFELADTTGSADDAARATFDRIVSIGLDVESHPDTPASLVDFIDNQAAGPMGDHARDKMLELLATPDIAPAAARRAAHKVVGSGHDYAEALLALDPADCGARVAQLYALTMGDAPPVVGLAGDPDDEALVRWLSGAMVLGALPDENEWAQAAGDYDALVDLAGSRDAAVAAGAAAALVLRAGGTAEQQAELIDAVARLNNPTRSSVASVWEPIRRDIFALHLADAAGAYRITLSVYAAVPDAGAGGLGPVDGGGRTPARGGRGTRERRGAPGPGPGGPGGLTEPGLQQPPRPSPAAQAAATSRAANPTATYDLGLVELQVDGDDISLSIDKLNIRLAQQQLALQITRVSDLADFDAPGLDELPLSQLDEQLDLLPIDADTWVGSIELPDGRTLEVSFTRER